MLFVVDLQGNSAGRFKAFYYYNTPAVFEVVMDMIRPLLNKKFKDRVDFAIYEYNLYKICWCIHVGLLVHGENPVPYFHISRICKN